MHKSQRIINMNKYILFLILTFFNLNIFSESNIFGYWLTSGSIVKIKNCDDFICANIETIFVEDGVNPESLLDLENKDKKLRSRTLVGINLLSNFKINENNQKIFKGGKIYDPRSGNTYKSNLYLNDDGSLKVEGCLAFICDGEVWEPLIVKINDDGSKEAILKNSP